MFTKFLQNFQLEEPCGWPLSFGRIGPDPPIL